jgi:menaquinone-9 beta-reductase
MIGAVLVKASYDIVIVGGGIAGSSLGTVLARQGVGVLVLERTTVFADRVRGEAMMPWGVAEAKRLGLYDVLMGAGGHEPQLWMQYDEGAPNGAAVPVGSILPDNAPLNLGHPKACETLIQEAASSGAEVLRGVDNVQLTRDPNGIVFTTSGETHQIAARLVVGADGRRSAIRDQAAISLEEQEPPNMIAGLLIEPVEPLPDHDVIAVEGDVAFLSFLQRDGRSRLYIMPTVEQRDRYTGRDGTKAFLGSTRLSCLPMADTFATAKPAGPCVTYPGDDTWTRQPFADGVVLIGDAAGYNNPIIGQGLSLAMRDVRIVSEALIASDEWSTDTFRSFGDEKMERMRRVRITANLAAKQFLGFAGDPEGRMAFAARRFATPALAQGFLTLLTGPESAPEEAFDDEVIAQLVGAY